MSQSTQELIECLEVSIQDDLKISNDNHSNHYFYLKY